MDTIGKTRYLNNIGRGMNFFRFFSPLSRCGPGGLLSPGSTSGSFSPHSLSTCSVDISPSSVITTTTSVASRRAARDREREDKNRTHIKKPLNAFMLYMKEMRPKIVAECTLKESAAINQILGRRVRSDNKKAQKYAWWSSIFHLNLLFSVA